MVAMFICVYRQAKHVDRMHRVRLSNDIAREFKSISSECVVSGDIEVIESTPLSYLCPKIYSSNNTISSIVSIKASEIEAKIFSIVPKSPAVCKHENAIHILIEIDHDHEDLILSRLSSWLNSEGYDQFADEFGSISIASDRAPFFNRGILGEWRISVPTERTDGNSKYVDLSVESLDLIHTILLFPDHLVAIGGWTRDSKQVLLMYREVTKFLGVNKLI